MKDPRLYGKFTLGFPNHPKILILSDAAFRCLVEATLWSREQEKDGFLARRLALAKWSLDVLQELCVNDDENPSLIEREEGWYIHDYAEHQETKADVEARRERNRINGQKGGLAKSKRTAKRLAKPVPTNLVSEKLAEKEEVVARASSAPIVASSERPHCPTHPYANSKDACGDCQLRREWDVAQEAALIEAKRLRHKVVVDCPDCDDFGRLDDLSLCPKHPSIKDPIDHQEAAHG